MLSTDWRGQQKQAASAWAQGLFEKRFLILDTETSGIRSGFHEIVQIGVLDSEGNVLMDTLVQPVSPERVLDWSRGGKRAVDVHGITPQMLENAPTFPAVYDPFCALLKGRQVVVYNADFDRRMIEGDCLRHRLDKPAVKKYHCTMKQYAQWYGMGSSYGGGPRWQSLEAACRQLQIQLPERAHSAIGDCLRTLEVMKRMAGV
jgi:DNA polymerase-3 subunit epsilon